MSQLIDVFKQLYDLSPSSLTGREYNLDTIKAFLDHIGNPEKKLDFIHVGGTSGKGSTAKYIAKILNTHGLVVGEFYSPHVFSVRERIQLNDQWIAENDFEKFFFNVRKKIDSFEGARPPTFFEALFCMALLYFVSKKVDVVVVEVGLGGKLDATNVIDSKLCVVTNVGLDHTDILGDTVEKIAADKVQIVKDNSILVSGITSLSLKKVINSYIKKHNSETLYPPKDFGYKEKINGSFDYYEKGFVMKDLKPSMLGRHQIINAAIAIKTSKVYLEKQNILIGKKTVKEAVNKAFMPGRIQIVSHDPFIIWDAAHNVDKMTALIKTLEEFDKEICFLIAFKRGQKILEMAKIISSSNIKICKIVLTKYKIKQDVEIHSENYTNYVHFFETMFGKSKVSTNLDARKAYNDLRKNIKDDQALVVTGSFYLLDTLARSG